MQTLAERNREAEAAQARLVEAEETLDERETRLASLSEEADEAQAAREALEAPARRRGPSCSSCR